MKKVVEVMRAKADIKDFHPGGLPQLQDPATAWVCIGKHLCGAATDLTLRCCTQWTTGMKYHLRSPLHASMSVLHFDL